MDETSAGIRNATWYPRYVVKRDPYPSVILGWWQFWNVRLASKNFNTPSNSAVNSTVSLLEITPANSITMTRTVSPASENEIAPAELKDRQEKMEIKVQQIWHVLSGYEESSAALIGEMLRAVNGQQLLDIVLLAEKFILHVEVLFAVIDDLEAQFALAGVKGEQSQSSLSSFVGWSAADGKGCLTLGKPNSSAGN
jgi:hypothetical protein